MSKYQFDFNYFVNRARAMINADEPKFNKLMLQDKVHKLYDDIEKEKHFFNRLSIIIELSKNDAELSKTVQLIADGYSHSRKKGAQTLGIKFMDALELAVKEYRQTMYFSYRKKVGPIEPVRIDVFSNLIFHEQILDSMKKTQDGVSAASPKFLSQIMKNMLKRTDARCTFSKKIRLYMDFISECIDYSSANEINDDSSLSDLINLHKGMLMYFCNDDSTNHTRAEPESHSDATEANMLMQKPPPRRGVCVTGSEPIALDGLISFMNLDPAPNDTHINLTAQSDGHNLPSNFFVGPAVADGSCFFDSFRQGLQRLGIEETVENMRRICKEYAECPPDWFVTAIANSHDLDEGLRSETPQEYVDAIERRDRWGDPDVEGRILCGHFRVTLYLIEKQTAGGQDVCTYQMIERNGCKCVTAIDFQEDNSLYIINRGRYHFQPVLDKLDNNSSTFVVNSDVNAIDTKNRDMNDCDLTIPLGSKPLSNTTLQITNNLDNSNPESIDLFRYLSSYLSIKKWVVINTLNQIENVISNGDVNRLSNLINVLYRTADKASLTVCYNDKENSIRDTHLITLVCKYNQPLVLDFLLHKSNILYYLPNEGPAVEEAYKQAVCATMRLNNSHMLHALYDYWSGKRHWRACAAGPSDARIRELRWLQRLLIDSKALCKAHLKSDEQMHVNVQCLIWFSSFQIRLYNELSELKSTNDAGTDKRRCEVEATRDMLLTAFRVYEEYCNKNIRLPKHLEKEKLEPLLDEDSLNVDHLCYAMYELYYRKLAYNIILLIINNLHFLKLRLTMPNDTYQEIECTLYYFLYRNNEDWRLYLPETRNLIGDPMVDEHEKSRVKHEPLIYLEWLKFEKSLNKFKVVLENVSIDDNLRTEGTSLPKLETHSLRILPYMRDDYTLKKILHYMDQLPCVNFGKDMGRHGNLDQKSNIIYCLMLERVIQVTGEFLKSTSDTYHLSPIVMALLQAEIPRNTYKNLQKLRDNLSHMKDGQLIRRIDLEASRSDLFENVLNDLEKIKKAISEVINVHKPFIELFLLESGKELLIESLNSLINDIAYKKYATRKDRENSFLSNRAKLSIDRSGMRLVNRNHHETWAVEVKKFPQYAKTMMQIISDIESQNKSWESFIKGLTLDAKDYPNKTCIENIKKELKTTNNKDKLKEVKEFEAVLDPMTDDYKWLQQMFIFIIHRSGFFVDQYFLNRWNIFDTFLQRLLSNPPAPKMIRDVRAVTELIPERVQKYNEFHRKTSIVETDTYNIKHIDALAEALLKKRFITQKEKKYLEDNIVDICACPGDKQCRHKRTRLQLLDKIHNDIALEGKDHKKTMELKMNDKCRRIISNIVLGGGKRDRSVLECLVDRTRLLNIILEGDRDKDELVLKYMHDQTFRLALEMIASDIMNIYKEDGWLKELSNTRYTELLSEYPLRNILDHGHPLIDIGSASFDAKDFPNALVSFALEHLEHNETCIEHLYKLYEGGVDRNDVMNDSSEMTKEHKQLADEFKRCNDWMSYVPLLPEPTKEKATESIK